MTFAILEKSAATVLRILILTAAISIAGCASYSHTNVQPSDALNILRVGDEVEITRKDESTAYLKIEELSDTEVSGSLLTNVFGKNVSIPFSDIASITRYTKDGYDSDTAIEVIGSIVGLALFASIL